MTEHQQLLAAAARCEQDRRRFPATAHGRRAQAMLAGAAAQCRAVAEVVATDPTLDSEPFETGRTRLLDLLVELARQLSAAVRHAELATHGLDRYPREQRRVQAGVLADRLDQVAADAVQALSRVAARTPDGQREISRARLAARSTDLVEAARRIRRAIASAAALDHPDPRVATLAALADDLDQHALRAAGASV